ncbi:S8 family peptidase [Pseudonocardia abyssalis]|uniref:S8 family serine peptidase n=1 Tax=Pseudonocardia abyssalis TaxID=2792008 RepID=A0ABS6UT49_9PSEU|nr:S8 family serine peptidase [Pseudonocardia abyssalis]MBW0114603.1 S8 family serine peptidase [Pseudonocardia abyssalis]MBW0135438.1 S8 family serine peptidase [Pseudonocardia abyssalis]
MQLRTDGATTWPDQLTGRLVLVLSDDLYADPDAARTALAEMTGTATASDDGPLLFPALGIAIVPVDATATDIVTTMIADRRIVAAEPERVYHLRGSLSEEYLRGFADAAAFLHAQSVDVPVEEAAEPVAEDTAELTWGLQVTNVTTVAESGAGITVAVLDTGLDLEHPDFVGRDVLAESFVEGETAQDANGHGTHCIGTSCGSLVPETGPRYGVAHEARILAGKVLSDAGSGTDAEILAGMSWAIENGAQIISMSLGADVDEVSSVYETVGRRALAAGTLVIAAAGNNADRESGDAGFVGVPANSPSIMAVAAVDNTLAIAPFSARSSGVEGGQVDVAGPGVDVYSSWPMPDRYNTISGTSMATPHVAGVAALWAQRTGARGEALWGALVRGASRLPLPSDDVGAGLVQAPPPA